MKQVIINKLDGGYVVQTVNEGQQNSSVVRTTFGAAVKQAKAFFLDDKKEQANVFVANEAKVAVNGVGPTGAPVRRAVGRTSIS